MTVTMSSTMSARAQSEERKANIFLMKSITMSDSNNKQGNKLSLLSRLEVVCLRTVTLVSAGPGSDDSGSGLCMTAQDGHQGSKS